MSNLFSGEFGPYLMLLCVGFLPSEIWRLLSVVVARGLDEESQFVIWVRTVATTLLAGVVAKIIFTPPGALALVPLEARMGALLMGLASFYLARRSVFAAICVGQLLLISAAWWVQP